MLLVNFPYEELARMMPSMLHAEEGRTTYRHWPYLFGEIHTAEIGADAFLG